MYLRCTFICTSIRTSRCTFVRVFIVPSDVPRRDLSLEERVRFDSASQQSGVSSSGIVIDWQPLEKERWLCSLLNTFRQRVMQKLGEAEWALQTGQPVHPESTPVHCFVHPRALAVSAVLVQEPDALLGPAPRERSLDARRCADRNRVLRIFFLPGADLYGGGLHVPARGSLPGQCGCRTDTVPAQHCSVHAALEAVQRGDRTLQHGKLAASLECLLSEMKGVWETGSEKDKRAILRSDWKEDI